MYIDLSVPLTEETKIYPGDPPIKIKPVGVLEKDGFNDSYLCLGSHAGTHIDAPYHMVEGGRGLGQMPVEAFIGRGCYIRIADKTFDVRDLEQANIQAGDIVLFHTGMGELYDNDSYLTDYPAIPEDVARYLVEKKVKMVGVDMCSVDHEVFAAHRTLLGGEVLIIENLTNLEQLAGKEFTVYALPINLQTDGAPARVIAEIKT